MNEYIFGHEPAIRLGFFIGILALMGFWEWIGPRRPYSMSKKRRPYPTGRSSPTGAQRAKLRKTTDPHGLPEKSA